MAKTIKSTIDRFISLADAEKERVFHEIDAEAPAQTLAQSRPLNNDERRQWQRFKTQNG